MVARTKDQKIKTYQRTQSSDGLRLPVMAPGIAGASMLP